MIDDFRPSQRQPVRKIGDRTPTSDQLGALSFRGNGQPVQRPAPIFRTPEQVANSGEREDISLPPVGPAGGFGAGSMAGGQDGNDTAGVHNEHLLPAHAEGKRRTIRLFRKWEVSRKKFIIVMIALAVVLLGGGAAAYVLTRSEPPVAAPKVVKKAAPATPPAPIVSPLTGLTVTAEQRDRPVTGVMIENSGDARPQSGLKDAGVVFEAIAEAGITRFLALYQEAAPENVGPIRSSRPYYLDWAMAFDASYAHVGGSPDALQRIKNIGVKDLDQFFNPAAYHRITSRYAPHNVYTSINQLVDLAKSKGWDKSEYTSLTRKKEQPYVKPPAAAASSDSRTPINSINFVISGAFYNAHYDYSAATNTYRRSEGGAPHMDADTNTQIEPKVVIALVMPYSLMADGYHSQYNTTGSGKMYVFQDGTVVTGTWAKGEPKEQFLFKDDAGKVLGLNPGQTWISVVADEGKVSYQ